MKVQPPGEKLKAELDQIGQVMQKSWIEKAGSAGQEIVDAYKAAK